MHNQVYLIGRLVKDIEVEEKDNSTKAIITIAVQRSYKNEEGIYESDLIPCILWNGVATHTKEYCEKGDLVGIKGRLQIVDEKIVAIADKITFLSSKKQEEVEVGEISE